MKADVIVIGGGHAGCEAAAAAAPTPLLSLLARAPRWLVAAAAPAAVLRTPRLAAYTIRAASASVMPRSVVSSRAAKKRVS